MHSPLKKSLIRKEIYFRTESRGIAGSDGVPL